MPVDEQVTAQARSTDADVRQRAAQSVATTFEERDFPLVFELLGDRDWRVRKTIVEGLIRDARQEVVQGLIRALSDSDNAGKRNSATEALIRIGDRSIDAIVDHLDEEKDVDVRLSLVHLLGDLRNSIGFATLLDLVGSESDVNVASAVVTSIGHYRDAAALGRLLPLLRQDDLWVRFHVIEAVGEIGDRSALPAILPLYEEKSLRKPILEAVGKIADVGTIGFLMKIIQEEPKLNLTALRSLIRIADADKPKIVKANEAELIQRKFRESFPPSKIDPLIEHLRSTPKREVRQFILRFLGWSRDPRAVPLLLRYLEEPDTAEEAAQGLIDFGAAGCEAILEKLRAAEEDDVIALLLRIINAIGGAESTTTILQFLDHHNPAIRRMAIEALGQLLDPRSIDYLLARLDDDDVAAQEAAVNSVTALVGAFPECKNDVLTRIRRLLGSASVPARLNSLSLFVNIQGEGFPDELLLASKNSDPTIRQRAVFLMGRFSEERFADQLVLSLADESAAVRLAAINAILKLRPSNGIEPLISSLEDGEVWIRAAAAQALGEYRDPRAVEPLLQHLDHDPPPVRLAAIEALSRCGDASVRERLYRCLDDPDLEIRRAAVLALSRAAGDDALVRTLGAMTDGDWRIRAAAAASLGMRGDIRALEPLQQIVLEDPDVYVQQAAVQAIEKMPDRSSFPVLLKALENPAILDEVSDIFIKHKAIYRQLLEEAWRTADSRGEVVIAAILQAMKRRDLP
jgi:HEAT repeat protein